MHLVGPPSSLFDFTETSVRLPRNPQLVRSQTIWAIAFTHGCTVFATYLFLTWMPSYLQAQKG
ncbi:hypothetical protein LMG22931_02962 [Paraburkholderia nemoris]|jgi:hypothetical protein|nr:hypothetical protein LMG22931_02962 [Paraburkholderia nemoris]